MGSRCWRVLEISSRVLQGEEGEGRGGGGTLLMVAWLLLVPPKPLAPLLLTPPLLPRAAAVAVRGPAQATSP